MERTALDHRPRRYLVAGGFPQAQGAEPRDRTALLAVYVDVVVLRDVVKRHGVSNPLALRWLQRQLLALLEDAFLVRTVATHRASVRRRIVNRHKVPLLLQVSREA